VAPVEESFPPANTLQLGVGEVNEMESKLQATCGLDEGQAITVGNRRSAPNEVLHAIVTHQILLEKGQTTNQETISREDSNEVSIEDGEEEESELLEHNIYKEAGLSPQMMTRGNKRKGKKNIETNPTRIQARGGGEVFLNESKSFILEYKVCENSKCIS